MGFKLRVRVVEQGTKLMPKEDLFALLGAWFSYRDVGAAEQARMKENAEKRESKKRKLLSTGEFGSMIERLGVNPGSRAAQRAVAVMTRTEGGGRNRRGRHACRGGAERLGFSATGSRWLGSGDRAFEWIPQERGRRAAGRGHGDCVGAA